MSFWEIAAKAVPADDRAERHTLVLWAVVNRHTREFVLDGMSPAVFESRADARRFVNTYTHAADGVVVKLVEPRHAKL